jgi:tetratricopeptide (TPR) repeat protein
MTETFTRRHVLPFAVLGTLLTTGAYTTEARQATNQNAQAPASQIAAPVDERVRALEDQMSIALAVKDERIQTATKQLEDLYITFQIFAAISAVVLVVFTVRDISIRSTERQRQHSIDEIVKEMLSLQRVATQQQLDVGGLRVVHEEKNLGQQLEAMQRVNSVIEVVGRTLDFRQQQEAKVAKALEELQQLTAERDATRKQRLAQAIAINENFKKMSRMEFASLTEEQRKRGHKLLGLISDLKLVHAPDDFDVMGPLLMTCGAVAYYDNDVIEAKEYLDRAIDCRLPDHAGSLEANEDYRKRFAVIHYFRSLIHKNWGELPSAFYEIEQSVKLFSSSPGELLSPVTRAEMLSYIPGDELRCQGELQGLLQRTAELQTSLEAAGKSLNANQIKLRNRMLLLLGNTHFLQGHIAAALVEYRKAINENSYDYYALCSAGQCLALLDQRDEAASTFRTCIDAIERAGDYRKKRELSTRAVVGVTAALAEGKRRVSSSGKPCAGS